MKLNKIFMLAGIAMLGFAMSSCSDDDNDYTPGEPVSADCPAVSFVAEESGQSLELDPADPTEVTFTVTREKADAAASYNLTVLSNTDDVFVVPATVDFAAGAKEATVKVHSTMQRLARPIHSRLPLTMKWLILISLLQGNHLPSRLCA